MSQQAIFEGYEMKVNKKNYTQIALYSNETIKTYFTVLDMIG